MKKRYSYEGQVLEYDRVIAEHWRGSTMAESPGKAKSNLLYQFKTQTGRIASRKVVLPERLTEVG